MARKRKRVTLKARRKRLLLIKSGMLAVLFCGLGLLIFHAWNSLEGGENKQQAWNMADDGIVRICIDAGHGGKDCGAENGDRKEKDDNLALALAVRDACEERGFVVIMTREDDTYVSLKERCTIANEQDADLFVSLHRNSAESDDSEGVEIWTANGGQGEEMAAYILAALKEVGISSDRGVQSGTSNSGDAADYYVNKHTTMPACLVELGFISNETDNALFDTHLEAYAEAIAEGIAQAAEALAE